MIVIGNKNTDNVSVTIKGLREAYSTNVLKNKSSGCRFSQLLLHIKSSKESK